MKINIAVLFGGKSVEHDVSIESARSVCSIIYKNKKYNLVPIYIDKESKWFLTDMSFFENGSKKMTGIFYDTIENSFYAGKNKIIIDVAFSLIHGNTGEDGKLQGLLELSDMAYIGCDVLSSAIAMDKKISKTFAKINGVPVLEDLTITKNDFLKEKNSILKKASKMKYPLFVKPVSLGSSVGVVKVKKESELEKAILYSLKFDREIIIEKGVNNAREIVCGVLGNWQDVKASLCGEVRIKGKHEFYDYNAKYLDDNGMELLIPAPISKEVSDRIREYAIKIFKAIKGYGLSRIDFFLNPENEKEIYFCEINTIPGFTSHSLYPKLWENTGIPQNKLIDKLIKLAIERKKFKDKLKKIYKN